MQSYNGNVFSRVYSNEISPFAKEMGLKILSYYKANKTNQDNNNILDLGCGTGQVAKVFLDENYKVTGIDLSDDMLGIAKENNYDYLIKGDAEFIRNDMTNFSLNKTFGLAVSTYDAINHIKNEEALFSCFDCVYKHLDVNGYFIFDMNTRAALASWKWKSINVIDRNDLMMISRGIFNEQEGRAYYIWTGFLEESNGLYRRFEQTIFDTAFDTTRIKEQLLQTGWKKVLFANFSNIFLPIDDPEQIDQENALIVIAQK